MNAHYAMYDNIAAVKIHLSKSLANGEMVDTQFQSIVDFIRIHDKLPPFMTKFDADNPGICQCLYQQAAVQKLIGLPIVRAE